MIRWIADNLGTAAWDLVDEEAGMSLVDARDLVDRSGNRPEAVRAKLDEALSMLQVGRRVVICCDYGISRSNALAAGVLALSGSMPLQRAVRQVVSRVGETAIKLDMLAVVRAAIGEPALAVASPNRGRRILVTGCGGFVGSGLVAKLRHRHEVISPSRASVDYTCDAIALDLIARESAIDTIVHLAHPRVLTTNESLGIALMMLKNVIDVCVSNAARLLFLSSWEVFSGYRTPGLLADESLAPHPGGTYGLTKTLCEALMEHSRESVGLRYVLLRSSPVYGPAGDKPRFIRNFAGKAARNSPIVTHRYQNGFPMLDLMHVDDLHRAIVLAVESDVADTLHLGTGRLTSTADIARTIVALLDSASSITHAGIDAPVANIAMDGSRAKATLGWLPRVDLDVGLSQVVTGA